MPTDIKVVLTYTPSDWFIGRYNAYVTAKRDGLLVVASEFSNNPERAEKKAVKQALKRLDEQLSPRSFQVDKKYTV